MTYSPLSGTWEDSTDGAQPSPTAIPLSAQTMQHIEAGLIDHETRVAGLEAGGTGTGADLYPVTISAGVTITPDVTGVTPWPTDRAFGLVLTQDSTGGHPVTYAAGVSGIEDGPLPEVRTGASESTLLVVTRVGAGWWIGRAGQGSSSGASFAAPTITIDSTTSDSVTSSVAAVAGATAYRYRIDGGTVELMGSTRTKTTSGLGAAHAGSVEWSAGDGTTWSSWAIAAYSTDELAAANPVMRMSDTAAKPATEGGDATAGWSYTAGASVRAELDCIYGIPGSGTGYYDIKIGTPTAGTGFWLQASSGAEWNHGSSGLTTWGIKIQSGVWFNGNIGDSTGVGSAITAAAGQIVRVQRTATTVDVLVSSDDGGSFTSIGSYSHTGTEPLFLACNLGAGGSLVWVKGYGVTRWGSATIDVMRATITGTGITETGDATGWSYAMSATTGYLHSGALAIPASSKGAWEWAIGGTLATTGGPTIGIRADTTQGGWSGRSGSKAMVVIGASGAVSDGYAGADYASSGPAARAGDLFAVVRSTSYLNPLHCSATRPNRWIKMQVLASASASPLYLTADSPSPSTGTLVAPQRYLP